MYLTLSYFTISQFSILILETMLNFIWFIRFIKIELSIISFFTFCFIDLIYSIRTLMDPQAIQLTQMDSPGKLQFSIQPNLNQIILQRPQQEQQPQFQVKQQIFQYPLNKAMYKNFKMQIKAVIIISSTIWYFGFNRAMISAVLNSESASEFKLLFNVDINFVVARTVMAGVSPFGAVFGTILCSFLIRSYSARDIYFNCCMYSIIFTVITMYTQIWLLLIFRFFIGVTVGIYVAITPMFIRQITAKDIAPYFGTASVTNQSLGGLMSFAIGYGLYEWTSRVRQTWIIMCVLNIIPLIVVMICIKKNIIYQSPIFCLRKLRKEDARQIFSLIYQQEYVEKIIRQKEMQVRRFYMDKIKLNFINKKTKKVNYCRKDIALSIHLPVLRKMTGYLVIVLSSASLIRTIDPSLQRQTPIIFSAVYFISCFMSNLLVKSLPKRVTFQIGTVSSCILNLMLAVGYYFQISSGFVIAIKIVLIILYGMTLGPLVWPYLPQVVPARIIPLAQTMNFVIDCITLTLPPIILTNFKSASPLFFIFFAWDFLSIIINHFLIIQTKGKSINQIISSLNKQD